MSGTIKIIQLSPSRRPATLLTLDPSPPSTSSENAGLGETEGPTPYAITSVSWAPSCGRSYHLVATGSRDGRVRIWRVRPPAPAEDEDEDVGMDGDGAWAASVVGDFDDHK